jgi:hypothetical protein
MKKLELFEGTIVVQEAQQEVSKGYWLKSLRRNFSYKRMMTIVVDCKFVCFLNLLFLVDGHYHVLNIYHYNCEGQL